MNESSDLPVRNGATVMECNDGTESGPGVDNAAVVERRNWLQTVEVVQNNKRLHWKRERVVRVRFPRWLLTSFGFASMQSTVLE